MAIGVIFGHHLVPEPSLEQLFYQNAIISLVHMDFVSFDVRLNINRKQIQINEDSIRKINLVEVIQKGLQLFTIFFLILLHGVKTHHP